MHMYRKPDRTALVSDRSRNGLAYPPRCISREFEAEMWIKLLHGPHQTEIPLLDKIRERETAIYIALGDRDGQPQICLDQPVPRRLAARGGGRSKLDFFFRCQQRMPSALPQVKPERESVMSPVSAAFSASANASSLISSTARSSSALGAARPSVPVSVICSSILRPPIVFFSGPSIFIISFCAWCYVNQRAFATKFTVS